ncbi:MAG: LamG-like jellyroll fold domain-containing protein [Candidatus Bathyarchaeia archaeon]
MTITVHLHQNKSPFQKTKSKTVSLSIKAVLSICILIWAFIFLAAAQGSAGTTVGLWRMDDVIPEGYREITPDSTGQNHGVLVHAPEAPELIEGKFNKALKFDGSNGVYVPIRFLVGFPPSPEPIYVPISTSLDVQKEIKIEAWINVQGFKNVTYNNIIVKCTRTDASSENTTRIYGIAVKAGIPENGKTVPKGALSGYVYTDIGGFNEIVTTQPVVPLNEWIHVTFTRTLATGMHLYINGAEAAVKPLYGVQNPLGNIINGTEVYFGHDAEVIIDEIRISDLAPEVQTAAAQFDIGPNLLAAIIAVALIFAVAWFLRRAVQMWIIKSKS